MAPHGIPAKAAAIATLALNRLHITSSLSGFRPVSLAVLSAFLPALFLAQRTPNVRSPMDEGLQVHDILDPLVAVPLFSHTHRADVYHFLDAAGSARHDGYAVGEVNGFLDRMGDKQDRARVEPRQPHQFLL